MPTRRGGGRAPCQQPAASTQAKPLVHLRAHSDPRPTLVCVSTCVQAHGHPCPPQCLHPMHLPAHTPPRCPGHGGSSPGGPPGWCLGTEPSDSFMLTPRVSWWGALRAAPPSRAWSRVLPGRQTAGCPPACHLHAGRQHGRSVSLPVVQVGMGPGHRRAIGPPSPPSAPWGLAQRPPDPPASQHPSCSGGDPGMAQGPHLSPGPGRLCRGCGSGSRSRWSGKVGAGTADVAARLRGELVPAAVGGLLRQSAGGAAGRGCFPGGHTPSPRGLYTASSQFPGRGLPPG